MSSERSQRTRETQKTGARARIGENTTSQERATLCERHHTVRASHPAGITHGPRAQPGQQRTPKTRSESHQGREHQIPRAKPDTVLDLNKTVIKCPSCNGMPIFFHVEEIENDDLVKQKVRCIDCGTEFWVCFKKSSLVPMPFDGYKPRTKNNT